VAAEAAQGARRVILRSALARERAGSFDVLVLDGLGDLPAVYPRAQVAFVGGTLAPVGGHNLLEPAHAGVPVLHGPHVGNVAESARLLGAVQAALRVEDATALGEALCGALRDPVKNAARGAAGRTALAAHRGSAARTLALVERILAASGGLPR
jgi:3-deoxy-D-manno-octulosonic-acid transferase